MRIEQKSGDHFTLKFNYGSRKFRSRTDSRAAAWQHAQAIMEAMQSGDRLTITREEKQKK